MSTKRRRTRKHDDPVSRPVRRDSYVVTSAGWYPDPDGSDDQSYWNGTAWGQPPKPPKKSHKLRNGLLIAAGVFVAVVLVGNLLPKPEPEPGNPGGGESAAAAPSTTALTVSESPSTAAIMPTPMASTTATPDRPAGYVSRETAIVTRLSP
jgi:Protein of unknown function (DUF2510)